MVKKLHDFQGVKTGMEKRSRKGKWTFVLCAALAGLLAMAWTAYADSGIRVIIEGQEVAFDNSPVADQGTTLVPFRVLFEKLGLTVDWIGETKTIIGKGGDVTIELQLDRKTAVINGETVELNVAPRVIDGSTYVPLRLVGEATGRVVTWDGASRTITIGAAPAKSDGPEAPAKSDDPLAFYRSYVAAINAEDLEAVKSMIHPDSMLLEWGEFEDELRDNFRIYDLHTNIESLELADVYEDFWVVLESIETYTNRSGLFYPDNRAELYIHLWKDDSGAWKLYDINYLDLYYLVSDEDLNAEADIDADVRQAILDAVTANLKANQAKDPEAVLATYDPESSFYSEDTAAWLEHLFEIFDYEYDLLHANVIGVKDKLAAVYAVQKKKIRDDTAYTRAESVIILRQQADGSWKLYRTIDLYEDYIEE